MNRSRVLLEHISAWPRRLGVVLKQTPVRLGLVLALALATCSGTTAACAQEKFAWAEVQVKITSSQSGESIEIHGLSESQRQTVDVKIWLASVDPEQMPALAGDLTRLKTHLTFQPRYSLRSGKQYRVRIYPQQRDGWKDFLVTKPAKKVEAAKITAIHPAAEIVPANMLKFYVYFSEPMRGGEIYQYVRLREKNGADIELPFLEIEQEFWSRDGKRLTLLLDPGRIKRGLKPRLEMGPIFEAGKQYELVISGRWPDANGLPLGKDFVQRYRAIAEDYVQPDISLWKIQPPASGTADPLVVILDEPLDRAMLRRVVRLIDGHGDPWPAKRVVSKLADRVEFHPEQPWVTGEYRLSVSVELEDLAGNSIEKPFDVDVLNSSTRVMPQTRYVELRFNVD